MTHPILQSVLRGRGAALFGRGKPFIALLTVLGRIVALPRSAAVQQLAK